MGVNLCLKVNMIGAIGPKTSKEIDSDNLTPWQWTKYISVHCTATNTGHCASVVWMILCCFKSCCSYYAARRPHYTCVPICLSLCPSVCPMPTINLKMENRTVFRLWGVAHIRSNRQNKFVTSQRAAYHVGHWSYAYLWYLKKVVLYICELLYLSISLHWFIIPVCPT